MHRSVREAECTVALRETEPTHAVPGSREVRGSRSVGAYRGPLARKRDSKGSRRAIIMRISCASLATCPNRPRSQPGGQSHMEGVCSLGLIGTPFEAHWSWADWDPIRGSLELG